MKSVHAVLIVLIFFFSSCKNPQNGWTKWRGDKGDGVSKETAWDPVKLDSANIIWKKNIGFGHSAIAVLGDKCFVSGWGETITGKDTIGESTVYCLNVSDGNEVWKFKYSSANRSFPGPRSTPVIDGNNLYTISWEGKIFCLDTKSGKQKWVVDLIADSLCLEDRWGICPSPVIFNNLILLNLNKSGLALDKNNGKVIWNSELKNSHYSSVKLFDYNKQTAGVFMSDSMLYVVEPNSGKILNSFDRESVKGMENDAMVTSAGDLFLSNELIKIDGQKLTSIWINDSISSSFRTGAILGNYAYQFSDSRNKAPLCCVDINTGIPSWSKDLGRFGALTVAGDKLIILTGLGKVIISEANPNGFTINNELQVLPSEDLEKNWCWTAPTFFEGKLYIRNSAGDMACINLGI